MLITASLKQTFTLSVRHQNKPPSHSTLLIHRLHLNTFCENSGGNVCLEERGGCGVLIRSADDTRSDVLCLKGCLQGCAVLP